MQISVTKSPAPRVAISGVKSFVEKDYVLNLKEIDIDNFDVVLKNLLESNRALFIENRVPVFKKTNDPVKKDEFIYLSSQDFFSKQGKENAKLTLSRVSDEDKALLLDFKKNSWFFMYRWHNAKVNVNI